MTIKPASVGGNAGGIKFVHRGILFKFALDWVRNLFEREKEKKQEKEKGKGKGKGKGKEKKVL